MNKMQRAFQKAMQERGVGEDAIKRVNAAFKRLHKQHRQVIRLAHIREETITRHPGSATVIQTTFKVA